MPVKSPHPERLLALLREREPSIVQAGFDEQGEPYLFIEPGDYTDAQREALASLLMAAASGLMGESLAAVVH